MRGATHSLLNTSLWCHVWLSTRTNFTLLFTFKYSNCMGHSPSESHCHSTCQGLLRLLWNPKIRFRVYKSPPLVPILSQIYPVHTFPPYFLKIHSNIIPIYVYFFQILFSLQVFDKILYAFLISLTKYSPYLKMWQSNVVGHNAMIYNIMIYNYIMCVLVCVRGPIWTPIKFTKRFQLIHQKLNFVKIYCVVYEACGHTDKRSLLY
jgi:hypothetical protein